MRLSELTSSEVNATKKHINKINKHINSVNGLNENTIIVRIDNVYKCVEYVIKRCFNGLSFNLNGYDVEFIFSGNDDFDYPKSLSDFPKTGFDGIIGIKVEKNNYCYKNLISILSIFDLICENSLEKQPLIYNPKMLYDGGIIVINKEDTKKMIIDVFLKNIFELFEKGE